MFTSKNTGKIIISVDREDEKLNSRLHSTGIAHKPEIVLTTLLINFISYALEHDKNPEDIIAKNFKDILRNVKASKNFK